jgi:hypothetical protein
MHVTTNSISHQFRQAALAAIEITRRPMAIHELEDWVSAHDAELFAALANRCSDYARIILNKTPGNVLIRFKRKGLVPGMNRKTPFFGKAVNNYDPNIWIPVNRIPQNCPSAQCAFCKPYSNPSQINSSTKKPLIAALFPPKAIPPFEENVSGELFYRSLAVLNTLHASYSEFWVELSHSMVLLKEKLVLGVSANVAMHEIIAAHSFLAHPISVEEVVHILSYNVNQWIARPRDETITPFF